MKSFKDLDKGSKVKRLKKVKTLVKVPDHYNYLFEYYNKNGKNELLLYDMRELLMWHLDELPENVKLLLL